MKKVLLKDFLVCIIILVMSCNFIFGNITFVYAADSDSDEEINAGDVASGIVTGLIGILLWPFALIPYSVLLGISAAIGGVARLGIGDIQSYGESGIDSITITPFHILFNEIPLVDVNFFEFSGVSGTILNFREAVAGWYYTMRLLASMILLVILIYVGIRMALTSIATERAMYKKMLVDWVTSLALLFLLHYIMLFVFACNSALVEAMKSAAGETDITKAITQLSLKSLHYDIVVRTAAVIVWGMIIFQTISFLISYIKRMLTIGFLIIIAPLITITYSIDKIGDGKAQALNKWLKEFAYNILIQPFQCILYLVFANLALDSMSKLEWLKINPNAIGNAIFAVLCLHFVKEGEKIIKKIFGFDESTAGSLSAGAALTTAALFKGKDMAAKAGGAVSKGKNALKHSKAANAIRDRRSAKLDKKATKIANRQIGDRQATKEEIASVRKTLENKGRFTTYNGAKKKEQKLNEKAELAAQKKWEEAGHTGNARDSEEGRKLISEARNKLVGDGKNTKISGFRNGVKKFASSGAGKAISGMANYVWDNRKKIAGASMGIAAAGMGMAAGDFGDFSKAVIGYNMGAGFAEGYFKNSDKELRDQADGAAQLYTNLSGDGNMQNVLATSYANGENDIGKEIQKALAEIKRTLEGKLNFEQKSQIIGKFNQQAMNKDTAGSVTIDSIRQSLNDSGFNGTDEDKEQAVKAFQQYGILLAQRSLHSSVEQAAGMGIDREALASYIGDKQAMGNSGQTRSSNTSNSGSSDDTQESSSEVTETELVQMSSDVFAKHLRKVLTTDYGSISNVDELNRKIDELNATIRTLKSKDEAIKTEISSMIDTTNLNIKVNNDNTVSSSAVMEGLESQLSNLQREKNRFSNPDNNE